MDLETFLNESKLSSNDLEVAGVSWDQLTEIATKYQEGQADRLDAAELVARVLRREDAVHSVRMRLKEVSHLLEKIVRKRRANPERDITLASFEEEIQDLIGVRVLHLYKDEWVAVHRHIMDHFELAEKPKAYIREGDAVITLQDEGCDISPHPAGYRSVHYIIRQGIGKTPFVAEVQVRTLFEEAWSEVDHDVRYPHLRDSPVVSQFLMTFNRLAGSADEMALFIKRLCAELRENAQRVGALDQQNKELGDMSAAYEQQLAELRTTIEGLNAKVTKKDAVLEQLEAVRLSYLDMNNATRASFGLAHGVLPISFSHFCSAADSPGDDAAATEAFKHRELLKAVLRTKRYSQ